MTPGATKFCDNVSNQLGLWWIIVRISLEERLVYRGDFALGTLMRFLPIVTQIFLWSAVFESVQRPGHETTFGGFRYQDMVAYYLMTMLARAFSSMPGLSSGIARQIRDGELKKFLVQPIDMLEFLLLGRIAHKIAYYSVASLPFALVFFLCRNYFVTGWPPLSVCLAFAASLVMGFLIGFFMEAAIGLIGFWFLEVSSLLFIYMLFSFFLSGHMFPITLLPDNIEWLVQRLPLKYLAYFPAAIFLGKIPPDELGRELLIEAAWVIVAMIACRLIYARGLQRYSGFGG